MRVVVFSKDRACQLELLLRSLHEQCRQSERLRIAVLYKASDARFAAGYEEVRRRFPAVDLVPQTSSPIKEQIGALVAQPLCELFTFFTDDIVVIRPIDLFDAPFETLRERADVTSIALRLDRSIDHCQPLGIDTPPPTLDVDSTWRYRRPSTRPGRLLARLRGTLPLGDWAGSMFIDGYVFRHPELVDYFRRLPDFSHVTQIEQVMLENPLRGDRVVCCAKARIVNLVLNRVDTRSVYPHAGGSPAELNERFLDGGRLDYTHLRTVPRRSCHVDVPPRWMKA
ncbi:MAG: hypothetical protein J0L92_06530 [Deltaproteobacteria bacterium]|nr:hypothetical protein [Deltaproteobacteria bacterium]